MKFIDEAKIYLRAGKGGNGCVSFRREKYRPFGGPDGGDGGRGGDIIFLADSQMTTLVDFKYKKHYFAPNGEHGKGSDMYGKSAEPLIIKVPVGTLVFNDKTNELITEFIYDGQREVIAKGGKGGLGNIHFKSPTNQAPRIATKGEPGEEITVRLELKLFADVGIIGLPNAGKSTLISIVSNARPKIADYPFTTLVPNLGVVRYSEELSFVMADTPGLIKDAHKGVGLGDKFLRHIERCKMFVHIVAYAPERDLLKDIDDINYELKMYNPDLLKRPQIIALNKIDLIESKSQLNSILTDLRKKKKRFRIVPISGITREGISKLLDTIAKTLIKLRRQKNE
ncbi:MAG: GTPase ObgE [Deltaproteobacteria bacterium]|nr:GTPase ObgE [Deltaproteobacteria bacterium]